MAYTGVFPALALKPNKHGLFSAVKPVTPKRGDADEYWVRGFSQEFDSQPTAINTYDVLSSTDGENFLEDSPYRFIEDIKPFFIEVIDDASTLGLLGEDRFARVTRQLDASTQKAVERELWNGFIAQGAGLVNPYLTNPDTVTVLNSGAALPPYEALALLEHYIGVSSPTGEQGVIHLTRDTAIHLAGGKRLYPDKDLGHLVTVCGTPAVAGSGYSGDGPWEPGEGEEGPTYDEASDTEKWMFATGSVQVYLGDIEVTNDNYSQGYDVSGNQNDIKIQATRPAVVYFDTSIHLAVKVALSS
jgi:hypothetical protein